MDAVVTYKVPAQSTSAANVQTALGTVPLPIEILSELGVYVVSDLLSNALGIVSRVITLRTTSADPATSTAAIEPGYGASPLLSTAVTHAGSGYVRPPVFVVTDAGQTLAEWAAGVGKDALSPPGAGAKLQAYLKVIGVTMLSNGSGYSAATRAGLVGGLPKGTATDTQAPPGTFLGSAGVGTRTSDPPTQNGNNLACVRDVVVLEQGRGYSVHTVVLFQGARPSVRGAFAYPVLDAAGHVLSVQMVDPGDGYITTPQAVLYDPTGAGQGAQATANMMRGTPGTLTVALGDRDAVTLTVATDGDGYVEVPQVVIYDPTGGGSGAAATVGPVPDTGAGGHVSQMGLSRVDILARGEAYATPILKSFTLFDAASLLAGIAGDTATPLRAFDNLMKTAIQNALATLVTETVAP